MLPASIFTFFETTMPLIGIVIAHVVGLLFEEPAVYLGGVILIALGLNIVREASHRENEAARVTFDSLRGIMLAGFSISIDERFFWIWCGIKWRDF